MPNFRFSIRAVLIAVGFVAVNVATLRSLQVPSLTAQFLVAIASLLPTLNLLALDLIGVVRRLARVGECRPFSVGLQFVGWPTALAVVVASFVGVDPDGNPQDWLRSYLELAFTPFDHAVRVLGMEGWLTSRPVSAMAEVLVVMVAMGIPPLFLPLLGGLASRRLGLVIARRPIRPT